MREILFRGKRVDNGEWVQGDLLQNLDCLKIREQEKDIQHIAKSFVILPETIGQYTGINVGADKLFEGDIIEWVEDYDDNWGDSKTYIGRSLVIWDNDNSCWAAKTDTYIQFFNDFSWDRCYVIGNIHDNPELLQKDDAE